MAASCFKEGLSNFAFPYCNPYLKDLDVYLEKKKKGSSDSGISRQERILVACFSGKRGWVEFPKKPDE